ncbi:MAG: glycosyltransferase family 87 protein [Solirubrobacteraceae bacterium]
MTHNRAWLRRTLSRVFIVGPLLLAGPLLTYSTIRVRSNHALFDFRGGMFNAGLAILHGVNPYQAQFLAHQTAIMHAGGIAQGELAVTAFSIPVYPAFANLLIVPLSLLPFTLAAVLFTLASVAAMIAGVWLLGVRDWRCFALALISWPFLVGAYLGAIGPFLVLGVGAAWRWRARVFPPALAVAAIVAAKIFPWPLGVWLLITRRYKPLAMTLAVGIVLTFGAWAVIGFHGLAQYPQMLSDMTFLQQNRAVSIVGVLLIAGVPSGVATVAAIAIAAGILFAAWRLTGGPDGDRRAFGLAILAALSATPIVWDHYMVLLFVPIALASPGLSAAWFIPLCTPLTTLVAAAVIPQGSTRVPFSPDTLRQAIPWLLLQALTAFVICTTPERRAALCTRLRHPGVAASRGAVSSSGPLETAA